MHVPDLGLIHRRLSMDGAGGFQFVGYVFDGDVLRMQCGLRAFDFIAVLCRNISLCFNLYGLKSFAQYVAFFVANNADGCEG